MINKINILGVKIDNYTFEEFNDKIYEELKHKNNLKIFTPNPEIILEANQSKTAKQCLESADILIPDGVGVIVGSKILGTPLHERLAGIDAAESIISYASQNGLSLFLLGGKPGVAEKAAKELKDKYLNLNICGFHHGYFNVDSKENTEVINKIKKTNPDILFVCMGYPRQETWIANNSKDIPSLRLSMGLGGSMDVWSGNIKRAPLFFRKISLEWLWRIMIEPKRIVYFTKIPIFLLKIISQKFKKVTIS